MEASARTLSTQRAKVIVMDHLPFPQIAHLAGLNGEAMRALCRNAGKILRCREGVSIRKAGEKGVIERETSSRFRSTDWIEGHLRPPLLRKLLP